MRKDRTPTAYGLSYEVFHVSRYPDGPGGIGGAGIGGTYNYTKTKEGYDRAFSACMSGRGYTAR